MPIPTPMRAERKKIPELSCKFSKGKSEAAYFSHIYLLKMFRVGYLPGRVQNLRNGKHTDYDRNSVDSADKLRRAKCKARRPVNRARSDLGQKQPDAGTNQALDRLVSRQGRYKHQGKNETAKYSTALKRKVCHFRRLLSST